MNPTTLMIIAVIVVLICMLYVYKRQNNRITSNLHADNLKQQLTLSALEYKFNTEVDEVPETQSAIQEITQLISCYERGEIQAEAFQSQMDCLLNKC